MTGYNAFCTAEQLVVTNLLKSKAVSMFRDLVPLYGASQEIKRAFVTEWITKWENICFCMQYNDNITVAEYKRNVEYVRSRIRELCWATETFDLFYKYN